MGSGGDGLIRLNVHISKGQSVRFSDGGLFLQMDGGMSIAGQDCVVCGGCFLPTCCMPFRDA